MYPLLHKQAHVYAAAISEYKCLLKDTVPSFNHKETYQYYENNLTVYTDYTIKLPSVKHEPIGKTQSIIINIQHWMLNLLSTDYRYICIYIQNGARWYIHPEEKAASRTRYALVRWACYQVNVTPQDSTVNVTPTVMVHVAIREGVRYKDLAWLLSLWFPHKYDERGLGHKCQLNYRSIEKVLLQAPSHQYLFNIQGDKNQFERWFKSNNLLD